MANRRDAERQVDELQTLVAALNAQIQGMQAQLEVREKEARELTGRIDEYRARESAIVIAMTDTQQACARRISEAEQQAQNIVTNANEQSRLIITDANARLKELEKKAKAIESDAYTRADAIIAKANETATKRAEQSEREVGELRSRIDKLNSELKQAVTQARDSANGFAAALEGISVDTQRLRDEGSRELVSVNEEEQKEYDNAATFIRDMYKLEGRGMPDEDAEAEKDEERVWTVDEIIAFQAGAQEGEALPPSIENVLGSSVKPEAPVISPDEPPVEESRDPFKRNSIFPELIQNLDDEGDPIDIDSLLDELME